MDKYTEANHRLAELLDCDSQAWCHDNAAAFSLMVEHGCDIITGRTSLRVGCFYAEGHTFVKKSAVYFHDHPDRETAVRYAIVQAVIAKLEG